MVSVVDFVRDLRYEDLPASALGAGRRCLLDLCGVAAAGTRTSLSRIMRAHALAQFGAEPGGGARLLLDGRRASPVGAALAGAATIDSFDAHDGHRLAKGHVGVTVLPALLAALEAGRAGATARELLAALVLGYEVGTRAGIAAHRSAAAYHASGSWNALAGAALGARFLDLDADATREALGAAEYHAPIGCTMRSVGHPSMVKDSSAWGAAAGISAALLAAAGFTGAPAMLVESEDTADVWSDLGSRWYVLEQYLKPWPVCRWAHPAIRAALTLRRREGFTADAIETVTVHTFHEATRLPVRRPRNTEEAQYSLAFPLAAALARGRVGAAEVLDDLDDPHILALSERVRLVEAPELSARFPAERLARVTLSMADGRELASLESAAPGDPEAPLGTDQVRDKFRALAEPVLGAARAGIIDTQVAVLGRGDDSARVLVDTLLDGVRS